MLRKLCSLSVLFPLSLFAQSPASIEFAAKAQAALQNQAATVSSLLQQPLVCDPVTLPYLENFEGVAVPALPDCTTAVNAGSGNTWATAQTTGYGFNSKTLRYTWNTSSPANTWFFTKGLSLEGGQTYTISYKYGSAGSALYTEKLKVHVGTDAAVSAMNPTPLIDHPLVNNNVTPITDNLQFTPSASGVYYVGFHCYSNTDQFYLFVDDISVSGSLSVDGQHGTAVVTYPNPVKDVLHIENAGNGIRNATVYDMLGQKVYSRKANEALTTLDLAMLAPGNYLLELSGETTSRTRIVKQ